MGTWWELTVPVLEKQVHSQDRGLAAHVARRVSTRLNHATKFRAPAWLPSVEESEQLAELRRILVGRPQQFSGDGPKPHILGESDRAPMKALVKQRPEPGLWLSDEPVPAFGPDDVLVKIHKTAFAAPTSISSTGTSGPRRRSRRR
jgi:hypothetical protein